MTEHKNAFWLKPPQAEEEVVPFKTKTLGGSNDLLLSIIPSTKRSKGTLNEYEDTTSYTSSTGNSAVIFPNVSETLISSLTPTSEELFYFADELFIENYQMVKSDKFGGMSEEQYFQKYAASSFKIEFTVDDYLKRKGKYPTASELKEHPNLLKSRRKEEKKKIKDALERLSHAQVRLSNYTGRAWFNFVQYAAIEDGTSKVIISFTNPIAYQLASNGVMVLPKGYEKLSANDPLSTEVLFALHTHYRLNNNKPNKGSLKLENLRARTTLPSLEELSSTSNRAISQRIIEPLTIVLDNLCTKGLLKSAEFYGENNTKLDDDFFANKRQITEDDYSKLYVHFEPIDDVQEKVAYLRTKKHKRKTKRK